MDAVQPRGLSVRPYRESDRQPIEALFDEFQDFFVPLDPLRRTRRLDGYGRAALRSTLAAVGADGLFLLAELGGEIAGFMTAVVRATTPEQELEVVPGRWGRVTELFVREEFRRSGVGAELMARAEDFFRRNGCQTARVEVFAPNRAAHRFYEELGYADRDVDLIKAL